MKTALGAVGCRSAPEGAAYFAAEKRLSNELVATIGCDPATKVSLGGAAAASTTAAGCASAVTGLNGGCAAACLVSGCLVAAGLNALGCGLASATLDLAG